MEQKQKRLLASSLQGIAAACFFILGSSVSYAQEAPAPLPYPALSIPLATTNAIVKQETEIGFTNLLLGWEQQACYHFARAIEEAQKQGQPCLMSHCGMMLAVSERGAKDANRIALLEVLESSIATPIELFYINTFLKLLEGDIAGAATDFEARAAKYRRDAFSRNWAIMLLHCADVGYDMLGRPEDYQRRALDLAEEQYRHSPQDFFACYLRAYIEESAPQVSEQALESASKAAEMMPEHPMPALLYGHLLYRQKHIDRAIAPLKTAYNLAVSTETARGTNRLSMITQLYLATALWANGADAEASDAEKVLLRMPHDTGVANGPEMILLRWEARTFALRKLLLSKHGFDIKELRTLLKSLPQIEDTQDKEALRHYRECLKAALYARARMSHNDKKHALQSLKLAKEELAAFEESMDAVFKLGPEYYTPWYRAKEVCQIAVLVAGAEIYPDPDEFWKTAMHSTIRPSTMLMPPSVPMRLIPAALNNDTISK